MSTTSRKGSHGLRVLLEWIRTLPLHRTEREVMFVYAEHADYWDGSNSRPSVATVAKKAVLSDRRVQQILRKLQAAGHLVETEAARGNAPATYRLNVVLPISAVSTVSTEGRNGGVKSTRSRGEISAPGGVKSTRSRGEISDHAIRKTVRTVDTTVQTPAKAAAQSPWEKLPAGLQRRVLREIKMMREASVGVNRSDFVRSPVWDMWVTACSRADIWPEVAEQIADYFHAQEYGETARKQPRPAAVAGKKTAGGTT